MFGRKQHDSTSLEILKVNIDWIPHDIMALKHNGFETFSTPN